MRVQDVKTKVRGFHDAKEYPSLMTEITPHAF